MAFKCVMQGKETPKVLPLPGRTPLLRTGCALLKSTLFSASMLPSMPWSLSFLAEQIPSQLGMEQLIPEKTELTWDYIDYKSKTR